MNRLFGFFCSNFSLVLSFFPFLDALPSNFFETIFEKFLMLLFYLNQLPLCAIFVE